MCQCVHPPLHVRDCSTSHLFTASGYNTLRGGGGDLHDQYDSIDRFGLDHQTTIRNRVEGSAADGDGGVSPARVRVSGDAPTGSSVPQ